MLSEEKVAYNSSSSIEIIRLMDINVYLILIEEESQRECSVLTSERTSKGLNELKRENNNGNVGLVFYWKRNHRRRMKRNHDQYCNLLLTDKAFASSYADVCNKSLIHKYHVQSA